MKFENDKLFIIEEKDDIKEEIRDLKVTDLEIFYI